MSHIHVMLKTNLSTYLKHLEIILKYKDDDLIIISQICIVLRINGESKLYIYIYMSNDIYQRFNLKNMLFSLFI